MKAFLGIILSVGWVYGAEKPEDLGLSASPAQSLQQTDSSFEGSKSEGQSSQQRPVEEAPFYQPFQALNNTIERQQNYSKNFLRAAWGLTALIPPLAFTVTFEDEDFWGSSKTRSFGSFIAGGLGVFASWSYQLSKYYQERVVQTINQRTMLLRQNGFVLVQTPTGTQLVRIQQSQQGGR